MMRPPRLSLAQVLILPAILAIYCGCHIQLARIWRDRFPGEMLDVKISNDGRTIAIAKGEPGRYDVLACDAASGAVLRHVAPFGATPLCIKVAGDCDTWGALAEDGTLEVGRLKSGDRWILQTAMKFDTKADENVLFYPKRRQVALSGNGKLCVVFAGDQIALVDIEGQRLRSTVRVPGTVRRVLPSNSGKQVFAVFCAGPRELEAKVLIDGADGRYVRLRELDNFASYACDWLGDDRIAFATSDVIVAPVSGARPRCQLIFFNEQREANARKVIPGQCGMIADGPTAASDDGRVFAAAEFNLLGVIDVVSLTTIYPRLYVHDCGDICVMSCSGDGREIAVTDGNRLFLADVKNGTARVIVPYPRSNLLETVGVIVTSMLLLSICVTVFWRTRLKSLPPKQHEPSVQQRP